MIINKKQSAYQSIRCMWEGGEALYKQNNLQGALTLFLDAAEQCYKRLDSINESGAAGNVSREITEIESLRITIEDRIKEVIGKAPLLALKTGNLDLLLAAIIVVPNEKATAMVGAGVNYRS